MSLQPDRITPEMAIAVSLLKSGRDLVLGVPALLIWQAIEGGTLFVEAGELPTPGTLVTLNVRRRPWA